jgi:transcription elongation factor GreA
MMKDDKTWALKTIIKSFGNNCDIKRMKSELVPSILNPGEWVTWSLAARKILENDASFGVNSDDISLFTVREREVSTEEKLANEFKAQKQFFARIDILMRFLAEGADTESELFADMFSYFVNYLKASSAVSEQILASFLVIRSIVAQNPQLDPGIQVTFAELYGKIDSPRKMYLAFKDTKNTHIRNDFLECIKTLLPQWIDEYIKLFPTVLEADMLEVLIANGKIDRVKDLAVTCFDNYRDYGEAAIYFFENCQDKPWFKEAGIPEEKQLITLIHIIDQTYREISNHVDTSENRKINRRVQNLLFKDTTLLNYILKNDEDTITRIYTLVDDVRDLDPAIKMHMRNRILEKHPDFKFFGTEEKTVAPQGLLVTSRMYDVKKQQLEYIATVEIPANSKEIGEAMAQGDLRENAEYKAAKERQGFLNSTATKLQEDINRAQIFDPTMITTVRVSFGTTVTLKELMSDRIERFTILGPWESDPEKGIISYMSPFGNAVLNSKEGEKLDFEINDRKCKYTVEKIEAAKF